MRYYTVFTAVNEHVYIQQSDDPSAGINSSHSALADKVAPITTTTATTATGITTGNAKTPPKTLTAKGGVSPSHTSPK